MPLYEYESEACAHRFEVIQKFSYSPISVCPKCGGPVQKLLSSPAIQFKGTGWYVTDYGKSGAEAPGSKESGAKGSDSKSSEGASGSASSKEASTPTSADSKSSTNSPPKEGAASAAPALAPTANTSQ